MNIELFPLDKVVIDGVSVCLGMEQVAVEAAIGKGEFVGHRYYYYGSEMAIDYGADKKVEFIEFLGGDGGSLRPMIYGVSAFDIPADELTELLKRENNGEVDDSERGYSYAFLNISVGVYREIIPADVTEMIEEMESDGGITAEDREDIEIETWRANHWATIGIGVAGYYKIR